MKTTIPLIETSVECTRKRSGFCLVPIAFALVSFGIASPAQAVSPKPGGGYPGGNTAEGQNALFSLTTGTYNTAVGLYSLQGTTTGKLNTATGAGTLLLNTGDRKTAIGAAALLTNSTGSGNIALGSTA